MRTTSAARTTTESISREAASLGPAIHPGEILLEEFLRPLEMTQAAAAKTLGMSTVRLNELVRGKRGVTADTALRLAQLFKTTPQFWMHMHQLRSEGGDGATARVEARQEDVVVSA
jgi:addiction module HigA family antidote